MFVLMLVIITMYFLFISQRAMCPDDLVVASQLHVNLVPQIPELHNTTPCDPTHDVVLLSTDLSSPTSGDRDS